MGYFYVALLLGFVVLDFASRSRLNLNSLRRLLSPALITALALGAIRAWCMAVCRFRGPFADRRNESLQGAALWLFAAGSHFWHFPGVHIGYYAGTVAGFWVLGTVWLIANGATALWRIFSEPWGDTGIRKDSEIVLSCAAMHLAFVLFFFGNPFSWLYYSYVLVFGIAATSAGQTTTRHVVVWGLALIALVGEKTYLYDSTTRSLASAPEPATAEFWRPRMSVRSGKRSWR